MSHPKFDGYALITGAGSGIGLALARHMAAHGHDLVLVVRDKARMESLLSSVSTHQGQEIRIIEADLSVQGVADRIFQQTHAWGITIGILLNNAGFGDHGPFDQADPEKIQEMMRVNIEALTLLTRVFLPAMVASGSGRILNVSSVAAFMPGPGMAAYFASKAYVLHFSEALRYELRNTGVTVTSLCPGPTRSNFWQRAGMESFRSPGGMATAEAVAAYGYACMMSGRGVSVYGISNRIMATLGRLLPMRLVTAFTGRTMA